MAVCGTYSFKGEHGLLEFHPPTQSVMMKPGTWFTYGCAP